MKEAIELVKYIIIGFIMAGVFTFSVYFGSLFLIKQTFIIQRDLLCQKVSQVRDQNNETYQVINPNPMYACKY